MIFKNCFKKLRYNFFLAILNLTILKIKSKFVLFYTRVTIFYMEVTIIFYFKNKK